MKLLYILLFLSSIAATEMVADWELIQGLEDTAIGYPIENSTEKENQELTEDESKIQHFAESQLLAYTHKGKTNSSLAPTFFLMRTPYLEIHSPPPE